MTLILKLFRKEKVNIKKNEWLNKILKNNTYDDILGLCKKVGIKELKKNDYSLTPGRYVGVNPQVSKELNNLDRINEIQNELKELNTQSSKLMNEIQKIKL